MVWNAIVEWWKIKKTFRCLGKGAFSVRSVLQTHGTVPRAKGEEPLTVTKSLRGHVRVLYFAKGTCQEIPQDRFNPTNQLKRARTTLVEFFAGLLGDPAQSHH